MKITQIFSLFIAFSCIFNYSLAADYTVDNKVLPTIQGEQHGRDCVERLWRAQGIFKQKICHGFPKDESLIEIWGGIDFKQTSKPSPEYIVGLINLIAQQFPSYCLAVDSGWQGISGPGAGIYKQQNYLSELEQERSLDLEGRRLFENVLTKTLQFFQVFEKLRTVLELSNPDQISQKDSYKELFNSYVEAVDAILVYKAQGEIRKMMIM